MKKILLPLLLLSCLKANSQVYTAGTMYSAYTDITPDTLLYYTVYPYTNKSIGFNLFDDPSDDFKIIASGSVSPGGTIASINLLSTNPHVSFRFGRMDSVYIPAYSFWGITKVAKPLNAGDQINPPSATWDTLLYLTDHTGYGGGNKNVNDWVGGDKYIGFKYDNGSTLTYGWMRVQCISKDSCYIKDYSYVPASLEIPNIEQAELKIFPNPVHDIFYLKNINAEALDISQIKIEDIYGKEIKFSYEINKNEIKINPGNDLPEGCYLFRCFSKDQSIVRKFIKASE
ncbi:MAG: T9SS type A sorting domain-containing protein [Bacteroidia bacterium]